jgi:TRAP-type transport system small permease protein
MLNKITDAFRAIGYVMIGLMVMLTFCDIVGRTFFHTPVLGTIEVTEVAMAVLGGIAIFHTSTKRGHIAMDMVFNRFPRKVQIVASSLGLLLGAAIWSAIAFEVFRDAQSKMTVHRTTDVYKFPVGPFEMIFAVGLGLFALTLLMQAFQAPRKSSE